MNEVLKGAMMVNIGEPQRVIIAEPIFEPVPQKEPVNEPIEQPEEVPVGDE